MLAERPSDAAQAVEEFKKRFGLGKRPHQPLSQQELEERRQRQKLALLALSTPNKSAER